MENMRHTRKEIGEMIGMTPSSVGALCSKSKKTLIPDPDDPNIIDLNVVKNARYVKKKITALQLGIKPKFTGVKKPVVAKEKEVKPKATKSAKPKEDKPVPYIQEPTVPTPLMEADAAKLRKTQAEAELKELELKQKRGDLISAGEVAPFVERLSTTKDEMVLEETLSLIKDLAAEFVVSAEFVGRFERDFIHILNDTNDKAIGKFRKDIE